MSQELEFDQELAPYITKCLANSTFLIDTTRILRGCASAKMWGEEGQVLRIPAGTSLRLVGVLCDDQPEVCLHSETHGYVAISLAKFKQMTSPEAQRDLRQYIRMAGDDRYAEKVNVKPDTATYGPEYGAF